MDDGGQQQWPLDLRGEEQGAGATVVEGGRGAVTFIGPADGRGGGAARSNDQQW
jgi:hypothetical protein